MGNTSEHFKTHKLPCEMHDAQSVLLSYNNESVPFIFGADDNGNIYKYNSITKDYDLFDTYKTHCLHIMH